MKYIFPLGEFIAFDKKDKTGFELLAFDASYLHVTAFAAGSFINMVLRHQENMTDPDTILHFLKGVRLLREKLLRSDERQRLSDATVSVVLTLATCAYGMGDYETAKRHMEGLHKIIKLRGGLANLQGPFLKKLLMEMLRYVFTVKGYLTSSGRGVYHLTTHRCDIGISLHTGSAPMIFRNPVLEPLIPYPNQKLWVIGKSSDTTNSEALLRNIDVDLVAAWVAMQKFCSLVNLAIETHRMFSMEIVLDTMASVMYRLLRMDFEIGSLDEAIRLGLLALCYAIFLQWQGMTLPSSKFPSAFKTSVLDLKISDEVPRQIVLWLLMTGGISIFTSEGDTWLKDVLHEHFQMCHITSWNELRQVLKTFMWIGSLHDQSGRKIFESLSSL